MFRGDIQGLRAIAVLSVVVFHAFPGALPGGYVGVDIFFVISGFLITRIILEDIGADRFSLAQFYRRRIRRIFPALAALLTACLIAGYFLEGPSGYEELGQTVAATAVFASNIAFWRASGYFDGAAELKPLLHTWSLAVEEQFYVLYPPLIYVLAKFDRRRLATYLSLLLLASLAISETLVRAAPAAAFYLTPSRGFELLIGAIVALRTLPALISPTTRRVASLAGLALIGASLLLFSSRTAFPGLAALMPCLGTALVIHAGMQAESAGGRLISWPPLQSVGDVSYSLYLWHWPILVYCRFWLAEAPGYIPAAVAVCAALVAAYACYSFIERPFLKAQLRGRSVLGLGATMIAVFAVLGSGLFLLQGIPARFAPSAQVLFGFDDDVNPLRHKCHNDRPPVRAFTSNCVFGAGSATPDLAVWGDSHGAELAVALGGRAKEVGRSVMEITSSACPPALQFVSKERPWCPAQNQTTLRGLTGDSRIKTVVLTTNAFAYENRASLLRGYEATVRALVAAQKHVILLLQIPTMRDDPPERIGMAVANGKDPAKTGRNRRDFDAANAAWRDFQLALRDKYATDVADPAAFLCDDNLCRSFDKSAGVLYFNHDHLSVSGAAFVSRQMADTIYAHRPQVTASPSACASRELFSCVSSEHR